MPARLTSRMRTPSESTPMPTRFLVSGDIAPLAGVSSGSEKNSAPEPSWRRAPRADWAHLLHMPFARWIVATVLACSTLGAQSQATLIVNAQVLDGTGSPPRVADVRILDGRIVSDRKSTRLNSSHLVISYAVFC